MNDTVNLVREKLSACVEHSANNTGSAARPHPGLLLNKGLPSIGSEGGEKTTKQPHIDSLCTTRVDDFYKKAFTRWLNLVKRQPDFSARAYRFHHRLLIGLGGGGALETNCAISHSYGMPYIPGSSIKGALRAWARQEPLQAHRPVFNQLFGSEPEAAEPSASLVNIYDAWWIPERDTPFSKDIVNSHHPEYYSQQGQQAASELDSPIPNFLLAVEGSFLFVVQGKAEYTQLVFDLLSGTLREQGVGAKTAAGYGYGDEYTQWNMQHIMTQAECAAEELKQQQKNVEQQQQNVVNEIASLSENDVATMFGKDINDTKRDPNFEQRKKLILQYHGETIKSWHNATKKTAKNRWKTYNFFFGTNMNSE